MVEDSKNSIFLSSLLCALMTTKYCIFLVTKHFKEKKNNPSLHSEYKTYKTSKKRIKILSKVRVLLWCLPPACLLSVQDKYSSQQTWSELKGSVQLCQVWWKKGSRVSRWSLRSKLSLIVKTFQRAMDRYSSQQRL